MRRRLLIWAFGCGLLATAFYTLRGESEIPDLVLNSVKLLKKPIEDLLPDLQDDPSNTQAIEQASLDVDQYLELHNNRERWNEMRRLIETGQPLFSPLPSEIAVSTNPVGRRAPDVPPAPGFNVTLPYESRLSVSGRKTIGMTYRSTSFTNGGFATTQGVPTSQSNFELQQTLQVRINGQIGRKVTVNVDFDDTKQDKKDISIVYKGEPDEIVQRAAFGDINLTLPQTEFVGYSKQVFGASAELKYKALKGYFIGSRTKGETETKEFVGNVILQRVNIPDTTYIRRRFYNYTVLTGATNDKSSPSLQFNIGSLQIWVDTQDTTRSTASLTTLTVDHTLLSGATSYTGSFIQLAQGIDYTVDASSGVVSFRNALTPTTIVAIDYIPPGQTQLISQTRGVIGQKKMIKFDETRITQIPVTEELTHYNIGSQKLVRDDGQGNFTLQLRDLGNNNISNAVGVQYLPNNSGQIVVDFEAGTFALTRKLPSPTFDSVYNFTPTTQSSFFLEFRSRVKTYTLRPNIVLNSERITLNGRVLVRDVDYFIDYETGFITFFNEDQITESSRIQATYDFSPFGIAGAQQDTLVGSRAELSMAPLSPILAQSLLGSTVIYDFAPKQTAAPDIRQTSGSFLVAEADTHFKDLIFNPLPFLKSSFSGEVARSVRNPNTFGKALIDNMEGIKDETSVSLSKLNWQIASNPSFPGQRVTYLNAIGQVNNVNQTGDNLTNDRVRTLDINPNAAALSGDLTQVLNINYDLTQSTEASIVTVLSPTGIDFSKKLYLEMWVQGDGTNSPGNTPSGTQMNVTLGQVSEDFDFSSTLKTEDANRNNTLDVNEDVGIVFKNPTGNDSTLGANNLRIDSNDLDRNGILDSENTAIGGNFGYNTGILPTPVNAILFDGRSADNTVDFSNWKFVRIPLNISSDTLSTSRWSAIKEMRIALHQGAAGRSGTIRIAKIAVVGNRWLTEPAVTGSTIAVKAINSEDDTNYVSPAGRPDFDELNQVNTALSGPQPNKRREQSLAIDYAFSSTSGTVTSKSVTVSPMDFTAYGSLKFFVYKNNNPAGTTPANQGTQVIFRAGSDTDYLEFSFPIDTLNANDWTELSISQVGSSRADHWVSGTAGGAVRSVGNPNLSSVAQMKFGVVNPNASSAQGELWIDELHGSDVIRRVGYATRLQSDFEIYGWGTFGLGVKDVDRNFETFTSAITNQDRREENAYLNLTRLAWFPMKFTSARTRTITPAINTVNSTLVSIQQEGRVESRAFSGSGTLQLKKLPKFQLSYDTDKTDSDQLFKTDKRNTYSILMDYTVPIQRFFLPRSLQLGYKFNRLKIDYENGALAGASDPFGVSDTRDDTKEITAKMSFQPLPGFTFNPNFRRSTRREYKDVLFSTGTTGNVAVSTTTLEYDKTKSQAMGMDGVLAFKRWFSPRLRYLITNNETYNLPVLSNPLAVDKKIVDRAATGEVAWDFAWRDFSRKARALQSLNLVSSYQIDDGDTWENVDAGNDTLNTFSVRKGINTGNRRRQTLRDTLRSTQRWSPFDWANHWSGAAQPLRTMSVTSTLTNEKRREETTGTPSKILTRVFPDLVISMTQTEYFFRAQNIMSNSQLNLKTQYKKVDTVDRSLQKSSSNGGDWRFTMWRKLDLFFTYNRTKDNLFDAVNHVTTSESTGETLGAQLGFNVGKWRFTPKYDQSKQQTVDSSGRLTNDLTTRTPALQVYADLFLPAGLKLPFGDLMVFSNRIRTTDTISLTQKRSSLNELRDNTDTYTFTTSNDYELTSNIRLTVGGSYSYQVNKASADANFYSYEFNSLLTIQF